MGAGAVVTSSASEGYLQFVDPNRKWYNNSRLIKLHAWIVLLYVPATVLPTPVSSDQNPAASSRPPRTVSMARS